MNLIKVIVAFIFMLLNVAYTNQQIVSSSAALKGLLNFDEQKRVLSMCPSHLRNQLHKILQEVHSVAQTHKNFTDHPINLMKLIRTLRDVVDVVDNGDVTNLPVEIIAWKKRVPWPNEKDMEDTYKSIFYMQTVYKLQTSDLIKGRIQGVDGLFSMDGQDILAMAKISHYSGLGHISLQWCSEYEKQPNQTETSLKKLLDFYIKIGSDRTHSIAEKMKQLFGIPVDDAIARLEKILRAGSSSPRQELPHPAITRYEELCRGENIQNLVQNNELYCSYKPALLPYYRFKEELHNKDPRISIIMDVITEYESTFVKQLASQHLESSSTVDKYGNAEDGVDDRTSWVAWLTDDTHPIIRRIGQRISHITGLSTLRTCRPPHSEPLQVSNYGIGGCFTPHSDFVDDPEDCGPNSLYFCGSGHRDATFMLYLSGVISGGATVFPEVGVHLKPVNRAAAFWYNTRRSGEENKKSLHAGCPVLLGEKWVANKWILAGGQTFRRPCGVTPDELD